MSTNDYVLLVKWNLPRAITAARTFIKGKNRKLRTKVSEIKITYC